MKRKNVTERFLELSFLEQIIIIITCLSLFTILFKFLEPNTSYACGTDGTTTVVVMKEKNSTLWEIAKRYCVGDTQTAVEAMVKTYGVEIHEGQIIQLPGK